MRYHNSNIKPSVDVLVPLTTDMSLNEVLGRVEQYRASPRYTEVRIDADYNAIVGVLAL